MASKTLINQGVCSEGAEMVVARLRAFQRSIVRLDKSFIRIFILAEPMKKIHP